MTIRGFKIPAFLTAWLFAFSLLSNCYCLPISFASERSAQPDSSASAAMPSHCEHHSDSAKSKNADSDCSPRYNADQFENSSAVQKMVSAPAAPIINGSKNEAVTAVMPRSFNIVKSPPVSPPEFFILHHSFLI